MFKLKIIFNINLSTARLLQSDLHAFPWKYKLREFLKDEIIFPLAIIVVIVVTFLLIMYKFC